MVLFLCIAISLLLLAVVLIAPVKLRFRAEFTEDAVSLIGHLGFIFGALRLPFAISKEYGSRLEKRRKGKLTFGKVSALLRRRDEWLIAEKLALGGRIGLGDAAASALFSGVANAALKSAAVLLLPGAAGTEVRIEPDFAAKIIWLYMEGILKVRPMQIIRILIAPKGTRRKCKWSIP